MNKSKVERIEILRNHYVSLHADCVKILKECESSGDLFYPIALDLRFKTLFRIECLDKWTKFLFIGFITEKRLAKEVEEYKRLNAEVARLDKVFYSWKRTGRVEEKKDLLDKL